MVVKKIILLVAVLAVVFAPGLAEAKRKHVPRRASPTLVNKSAKYADIVIDVDTGLILHQKNSEGKRYPASLTKMMTLYLAFQALESGRLRLNQRLYVSKHAARQSPSKLGLRAGRTIRASDAILGVVTKSANDAAVVLAEALGGSESRFAVLMTRQAKALGMTKTHFLNASGLPHPKQFTTARDMAIMGAALVRHYPDFYPYFSRKGFTYAGVYRSNHNHLMERYEGMDGIKTGYIRASGFNLVASVKRGDKRVIAVVFGGRTAVSRDNKMAKLLDDSFAQLYDEAFVERVSAAQGEGDSTDDLAMEDVLLPAKVAAVFPSKKPSTRLALAHVSRGIQPASYRSTSSVGAGRWGVQVGAFSSSSAGRRALRSLVAGLPKSKLPKEPDLRIQKIAVGGGIMYRARLMSLDQAGAKDICAYLTARGKGCLTLQP